MNSDNKLYRLSINRIPILDKPGDDFPWHDYNERFEVCDVTAAGLLEQIGKGHGFAPVFRGDGRPTIQNFSESPFIAVDMDTEDERSSLRTLVEHPLVSYHGALIYPTHSHRDEKPRHRVLFLLDMPIFSAVAYGNAVRAINSLFEGADGTGGPNKTWQANGNIDFRHLWDKCYLSPTLQFSPEMVTHYILQHKLKTDKEAKDKQRYDARQYKQHYESSTGDSIMQLSELGPRLFRLDPYSLSYDEWVKLGAALAHTYGDAAYWLFKDWSDRPGKQPLDRNKWQTFAKEAAAGKSAGYGSVIKLLKEHNV